MKLNIGCGTDYREGFVNIDPNPKARADLHCSAEKIWKHVKPDSVSYVMMRHSLEHVPQDKVFNFLDQLYSVCCDGAVIEIWVPHFSGVHSHHPQHFTRWGATSFYPMDTANPARTDDGAEHYTDFVCDVDCVELH